MGKVIKKQLTVSMVTPCHSSLSQIFLCTHDGGALSHILSRVSFHTQHWSAVCYQLPPCPPWPECSEPGCVKMLLMKKSVGHTNMIVLTLLCLLYCTFKESETNVYIIFAVNSYFILCTITSIHLPKSLPIYVQESLLISQQSQVFLPCATACSLKLQLTSLKQGQWCGTSSPCPASCCSCPPSSCTWSTSSAGSPPASPPALAPCPSQALCSTSLMCLVCSPMLPGGSSQDMGNWYNFQAFKFSLN